MKYINEKPEFAETAECEKHGIYEFKYAQFGDRFMVMESCPHCLTEARIAEEQKEKQEQEEKAAKRLEDKKLSSGISKRHMLCTFANYIADDERKAKAKKLAEDYLKSVLDGAASCLVMAGSVGTGKTHLAMAIANTFIESGKKANVIKMSELIRDIKDTWRKDSEVSETKAINHYSAVALLIIDEIGIQFGSDTEKLFISEIIDNRYQNMLPTVLISNLDIAGIKDCIGDRSYDRLRQDGGIVVAFNWESYRGIKK